MAVCPDTEQLRRYQLEVLTEEQAADVRDHIDVCTACAEAGRQLALELQSLQEWLERIDPDSWSTFLAALSKKAPHRAPSVSAPAFAGLQLSSEAELQSRYRILEEVGRGGMGIVYKAEHAQLERHVAIKIGVPGFDLGRFLREAKLLARIDSPHVVEVYDFAIVEDRPVLIMRWIEGGDLRDRIGRTESRALAEDVVLPWMVQTSKGMWAAEREGIVHRDLKPSNILLRENGEACVADFGLAKHRFAYPDLTQAGSWMGTPDYMAPEQAEHTHAVDTRADIYGFGATFYHALTGTPPFAGDSALSVLCKHKIEPLVPPQNRNPALSNRVAEVLERCLAKAPGDRFRSFADVGAQLVPAAEPTPPWLASDDQALAPHWDRYSSNREAYLGPARGPLDDAYLFASRRLLRILRGRIEAQEVDAIVSSDDSELTMGGGVSWSITQAAGPEVKAEAGRYATVKPGRAVVTSAGDLPARFVFHGITIGIPRLENASQRDWTLPSRDVISEIIDSCFYHADSLHVRSIAFPLLGTGVGGFEEGVCLDMMFRALANRLLYGLSSVREARILLYGSASDRHDPPPEKEIAIRRYASTDSEGSDA